MKFLALLLLLVGSATNAQQWRSIGTSEENAEFRYDPASIKRSGQIVTFQTQQIAPGMSAAALVQIDCSKSKMRVSSQSTMIDGVLLTNSTVGAWTDIPRYSIGDQFQKAVCNG